MTFGGCAYAILLAQALLLFRGEMAGSRVIPGDLPTYDLAFSYLALDAMREGELPLWDPYSYCGRPVAANPRAQVFYPPRIAATAVALATGEDSLFWLLEMLVAGHAWLAGCGAFRLARRAGLPTAAAVAAAAIYLSGGFLAARAGQFDTVCAAAWLPFAIEFAIAARPLALAAVLAMTVLAGFTPVTIVGWIAAAAFSIRHPRLLAAFPAAIVLSLVQLGPAVELMQASVAKYRTGWPGAGNTMPGEGETVVTRASFPEIRQRAGSEPAPFRVESGPGGRLIAQTAPITRIHHANGDDPMALESYARYRLSFIKGDRGGSYHEVPTAESPLLAETGAKLLVSAGGAITESPRTNPRFRLTYGTVRVVKFSPREVILESDSRREDHLVSAEVHYPGWRARIDGREQTIELDRDTFRSHWIPAGRHRITWRFEPWLLYVCGAISAAAWTAWVLAWLRWRGRAET